MTEVIIVASAGAILGGTITALVMLYLERTNWFHIRGKKAKKARLQGAKAGTRAMAKTHRKRLAAKDVEIARLRKAGEAKERELALREEQIQIGEENGRIQRENLKIMGGHLRGQMAEIFHFANIFRDNVGNFFGSVDKMENFLEEIKDLEQVETGKSKKRGVKYLTAMKKR